MSTIDKAAEMARERYAEHTASDGVRDTVIATVYADRPVESNILEWAETDTGWEGVAVMDEVSEEYFATLIYDETHGLYETEHTINFY